MGVGQRNTAGKPKWGLIRLFKFRSVTKFGKSAIDYQRRACLFSVKTCSSLVIDSWFTKFSNASKLKKYYNSINIYHRIDIFFKSNDCLWIPSTVFSCSQEHEALIHEKANLHLIRLKRSKKAVPPSTKSSTVSDNAGHKRCWSETTVASASSTLVQKKMVIKTRINEIKGWRQPCYQKVCPVIMQNFLFLYMLQQWWNKWFRTRVSESFVETSLADWAAALYKYHVSSQWCTVISSSQCIYWKYYFLWGTLLLLCIYVFIDVCGANEEF
jgi:hypothetical protein